MILRTATSGSVTSATSQNIAKMQSERPVPGHWPPTAAVCQCFSVRITYTSFAGYTPSSAPRSTMTSSWFASLGLGTAHNSFLLVQLGGSSNYCSSSSWRSAEWSVNFREGLTITHPTSQDTSHVTRHSRHLDGLFVFPPASCCPTAQVFQFRVMENLKAEFAARTDPAIRSRPRI